MRIVIRRYGCRGTNDGAAELTVSKDVPFSQTAHSDKVCHCIAEFTNAGSLVKEHSLDMFLVHRAIHTFEHTANLYGDVRVRVDAGTFEYSFEHFLNWLEKAFGKLEVTGFEDECVAFG